MIVINVRLHVQNCQSPDRLILCKSRCIILPWYWMTWILENRSHALFRFYLHALSTVVPWSGGIFLCWILLMLNFIQTELFLREIILSFLTTPVQFNWEKLEPGGSKWLTHLDHQVHSLFLCVIRKNFILSKWECLSVFFKKNLLH